MDSKELEFFKNQIESYINKARMGNVVVTNFLNETEQAIINNFYFADIAVDGFGGFVGAENKRIIFKPLDIKAVNPKIVIFKINYNKKYLNITHRNVLGTLMSLGIKRDNIGDIVIQDENAYFACTEEISEYIYNNFKVISKVAIELETINSIIEIKKEINKVTHIVSSLRLDVIISSAYKLSRNEANEIINSGLVSLNHLVCTNISKQVSVNDVISVRHKGRVYLLEIGRKTKSDKIVIELGILR